MAREPTPGWLEALAGHTDEELVWGAGDGVGAEPAWRFQSQAELSRRLMESQRELRAELSNSGQRMERLTRVLVGLTIAIAVMTGALIAIAVVGG